MSADSERFLSCPLLVVAHFLPSGKVTLISARRPRRAERSKLSCNLVEPLLARWSLGPTSGGKSICQHNSPTAADFSHFHSHLCLVVMRMMMIILSNSSDLRGRQSTDTPSQPNECCPARLLEQTGSLSISIYLREYAQVSVSEHCFGLAWSASFGSRPTRHSE